jgi:hypothetical protein
MSSMPSACVLTANTSTEEGSGEMPRRCNIPAISREAPFSKGFARSESERAPRRPCGVAASPSTAADFACGTATLDITAVDSELTTTGSADGEVPASLCMC